MDAKTIGKIIKQYRERKGLSQEVVSGLADISRSHLSRIETGVHSPSVTILYKLSDALGVKASDILRAAEENMQF
ncbi:MAG: helix-turn-helix domain-containing protein [Oscillospiraceae bacterium]|jgi:transcriptional regulator with XRE-family HTH domain|nr:helix-turn-helix domain-containing protein [Oscillospiraceae bacterium]